MVCLSRFPNPPCAPPCLSFRFFIFFALVAPSFFLLKLCVEFDLRISKPPPFTFLQSPPLRNREGGTRCDDVLRPLPKDWLKTVPLLVFMPPAPLRNCFSPPPELRRSLPGRASCLKTSARVLEGRSPSESRRSQRPEVCRRGFSTSVIYVPRPRAEKGTGVHTPWFLFLGNVSPSLPRAPSEEPGPLFVHTPSRA